MKRLISLILVLALVLSLPVTAGASNTTADVTLAYRGIKIVVDGVTMNPVDTEGNSTEPFIIDGTTYLPVRAVAGALGLNVGWDDATSTVSLSSGGETNYGSGTPAATNARKAASIRYRDIKIVIDGREIIPVDSEGAFVEPFIYDGSTYLPIRAVANALGLDVGWDDATSTVTLSSGGSAGEIAEPGWKIVSSHTDSYTGVTSDTVYTYDAGGRLTEERSVDSLGEEYVFKFTYDANGTLVYESFDTTTRMMDGDEHYVYTYDSEGRLLTGETSSFYTGSEFEEYTYDENGNVARYRWGDGSTEYTCDYTYNENGDVLTETNADGGVTRYEYNAAGLLVHSYDEPLNELSYQVFYTYDAVGKLLNVRYGQEYYGYSNISYTYDMYGNILTEVDDSEQYNSTYTYKYDSAGNIIYEKEEYGWDYWEYTYDSKGRLLESYEYLHDGSTTKEVYVYDAAGNVIRNEFTTTSYYGYVEEGVVLFNLCMVLESTYDDAGRIIREKVVISGEGTDETGTVTADYTYDANGNLVREETTTKDGVVVVTNEYKYFG